MSTKVTQGVAYALFDQFNNQVLPRARELEMTLDSGAPLGSRDMDHMLAILRNLRSIYPVVARLPEYRELAAGVLSLFARVARRACEAESRRCE
jgi:hypothetical protein